MPQPDEELWCRLIDVGTRELGITSNIVARLDKPANLRAASRASRQLLNRSVTCVSLRQGSRTPTTELAVVFPNADRMQFSMRRAEADGLASSSTEFLAKLRSLRVGRVKEWGSADAVCHTLLPRCSAPHPRSWRPNDAITTTITLG
jgi:hypothetical protein